MIINYCLLLVKSSGMLLQCDCNVYMFYEILTKHEIDHSFVETNFIFSCSISALSLLLLGRHDVENGRETRAYP